MKKVGSRVFANVRPALWFGAVMTCFALVMVWRLGTLVPGFSDNEMIQRASSATIQEIINNPPGLPHKVLQLGLQYLHHAGPVAMRSVSVAFGLVTLGSLYLILNAWYSRRVALLGTLLLGTSSWFLHTARLGTDGIIYTLPIAVVACVVWLRRRPTSVGPVFVGAGLLASLFYIPGMIWFILPLCIWQGRRLASLLRDQYPSFLTLVTLGGLALLAPIGWALYQDPNLIKTYVGLPQTLPTVEQFARNVLEVPIHLFWHGPQHAESNLANLPLIDWFGVLMFVVGAYAYFYKRRLDRTWFLAYTALAGTFLVALGGPVTISVLMPFVYLMIAGGVALMIQQWLTVFPRNPVARWLGVGLLTFAVLLSAAYGLRSYFVAWPSTPETKAVFHNRP